MRFRPAALIALALTLLILHQALWSSSSSSSQTLLNRALGRGDAVSDGVGLAQLRVLPFGSVDAYAEEERLQKAHEALFHPHIFPSERMGELEEHPPHLLAIGVLSAGPNRDRRDAIRETWAQWPSDLRHTVRFFIGQPDNAALMKSLDEEATGHKDMILLGVNDNYYNITLKTLGIFAWGAEQCGAYYVMKTDDDVYVTLGPLLRGLAKRFPNQLYGGKWTSFYTARRNVWDKWYVSTSEFPFKDGPGFNMGTGYVLSRDLALKVAATRRVRNWHHNRFEDVEVGFILAGTGFKRIDLAANRENVCVEDLVLQTPVTPGGMRHLYFNDVVRKHIADTGTPPPPSRCHEYAASFPTISKEELEQITGNREATSKEGGTKEAVLPYA